MLSLETPMLFVSETTMYTIVILFFVCVAFVHPQNNASTIEIYQSMANHKGTLMNERMELYTATRYRIRMDIPLQSWIGLKDIIQQAKTLA